MSRLSRWRRSSVYLELLSNIDAFTPSSPASRRNNMLRVYYSSSKQQLQLCRRIDKMASGGTIGSKQCNRTHTAENPN